MAALLDLSRPTGSATRAFGLTLAFVAIITGLLTAIGLTADGIQNLLLGGLIAFSLPRLRDASVVQQRSIALVTIAAALALAAHLLEMPSDLLTPLVLLALIAALSIWIGSTRFDALIPASAVILPLVIVGSLVSHQPDRSPLLALFTLLAAVASFASALVTLFSRTPDPTNTVRVVVRGDATHVIPSSRWASLLTALPFLGAALALTGASMQENRIWVTAGIMLIGTACTLATFDRTMPTQSPRAIIPIEFPRAALGLVALISGSASLVAVATTESSLEWQIGGVIAAGLFGLGNLFEGWWQDHTLRDEQRRRAISESRTDLLTGLHNRRSIDLRLQEELARAQRFGHPLSVLLIDLDDFKAVNDRFGHATGDVVLRDVARSIDRSIRSIDIAGRYGGEEFLVLLPETASAGAEVVAQRIRISIEETGQLTASIGLASFNGEATSADALVAAADTALYEAKRSGKNRVVSAG